MLAALDAGIQCHSLQSAITFNVTKQGLVLDPTKEEQEVNKQNKNKAKKNMFALCVCTDVCCDIFLSLGSH
jgi:hypothetical protein